MEDPAAAAAAFLAQMGAGTGGGAGGEESKSKKKKKKKKVGHVLKSSPASYEATQEVLMEKAARERVCE